jgi:hypothetical protein
VVKRVALQGVQGPVGTAWFRVPLQPHPALVLVLPLFGHPCTFIVGLHFMNK